MTNKERVFMRAQLAEMQEWAGKCGVPDSKLNRAMMVWIAHNAAEYCKCHHPDAPVVKGLLPAPNVFTIW